ncbi:MAG: hypothetical protein AB7L13_23950 [Acidimicrobiia bacterium]
MSLRVLRVIVIVICVAGIAGMIIGSIADNNNGVVITSGLITAVSILILMAVASAVRAVEPGPPSLDEQAAADLEAQVQALVDAGTDETALRAIVRDASRLYR